MSEFPLLQCQQLSKFYQDGQQRTQVLQQVSFALASGQMMAIVGSSGSGKSTLLHILGGLDEASAGKVIFQGNDLSQLTASQKAAWRNHSLGFIYQFHHLLADFTALENVAMPLLIAGKKRPLAEQTARQMLAAVGLAHRLSHRPSELSGGERQRVAIARAIANQPALVLADEPTGNLDQKNAQEIVSLLQQLNQQYGMAFLIVTHDLQLAQRLDRQLIMQDGQLLAEEQVMAQPIATMVEEK